MPAFSVRLGLDRTRRESMLASERPIPFRSTEAFVELGFNLLLGAVLRQHQLADQNLSGIVEHLPLAGGEAFLSIPDGEVAHDLRDLKDISALDLLQVRTVPAIPVLGHGRLL